jgi:hypothetical protein
MPYFPLRKKVGQKWYLNVYNEFGWLGIREPLKEPVWKSFIGLEM